MPFSTSLPAPSVTWERRAQHPVVYSGLYVATAWNSGTVEVRPGVEQYPGVSTPTSLGRIGGVGGTGVVERYAVRHGRAAVEISTTSAVQGGAWLYPWWMPSYGPASAWNPGATTEDTSVVAVMDFHVSFEVAAFGFGADGTGCYFMPQRNGINCNTDSPAGSAPKGGFGVVAGNDGAGNLELQYLATDLGGAVLERVSAPAGSMPDATAWSTVRFIIVTAASGREATLTVRINDQAWVTDREFGGALLKRPDELDATAVSYCMAQILRGGGGNSMFFAWAGKWGRFTPDGAAQQSD